MNNFDAFMSSSGLVKALGIDLIEEPAKQKSLLEKVIQVILKASIGKLYNWLVDSKAKIEDLKAVSGFSSQEPELMFELLAARFPIFEVFLMESFKDIQNELLLVQLEEFAKFIDTLQLSIPNRLLYKQFVEDFTLMLNQKDYSQFDSWVSLYIYYKKKLEFVPTF